MSKSAIGKVHMKRKDLACPRDGSTMHETTVGEAQLDVCGKCGGQYFDAGEMFSAFGVKADPSTWDRKETGGGVKDSTMKCARCDAFMLVQNVAYETQNVEIDRCGNCGGLWLDKGEVEAIMAIGEKLQPMIDAEKAQRAAEAAAIGDVDFSPGLISKFLKMFMKKK